MSRWASDPDAAADALIARSLDALDLGGRVLLANPSSGLPLLLQRRNIPFALWERRLREGRDGATPWPPDGPYDAALLRLAKAKDEQEMAVHASLSVLVPDGSLVLYGGNDEGIRSASAALGELCGPVDTVAARGHGRIAAVRRPAEVKGLRAELSQWRQTATVEIAGTSRRWAGYPGLFAGGRIDEGTELLLGALPSLSQGARVLDFGCGSGVIAAAVSSLPGVSADMMDNDSVALVAARENVPAARAILGTGLIHAGETLYDAILSNPPLHEGIAESHDVLTRLIAEAPSHLRQGGCLEVVVQRRIPLDRLLGERLTGIGVVAENARYRVWRAYREGAPSGGAPRS